MDSVIVKFTQLCSKFLPTALLNFACDGCHSIGIKRHTFGPVNRPNNISLSRANQSQAKFKSAVGGNLLQSWVNMTVTYATTFPISLEMTNMKKTSLHVI